MTKEEETYFIKGIINLGLLYDFNLEIPNETGDNINKNINIININIININFEEKLITFNPKS